MERVGVSPVLPTKYNFTFLWGRQPKRALGNLPVKNKLLLKMRSLEEIAAKLNMGFRGRYLNENVETRFLPSETATGMGKSGFP